MKFSSCRRLAIVFPLLVTGFVGVCASAQSKAVEQEKAALEALKGGEIATSATGFSMKAKLDGKEWVATRMMPTKATGRILGLKGDGSISLPFRKTATAGKTVKFGPNNVVDLVDIAGAGLWSAEEGEMVYTKVDDIAMEGTFFFTAVSSDGAKKLVVTEGTFRVLMGKR